MVKNNSYDFKLAAGRMRSLDPQNCISCGEPEMMEITNPDGLKGIHMKTVVQTGSPSRADAAGRPQHLYYDKFPSSSKWDVLQRVQSFDKHFVNVGGSGGLSRPPSALAQTGNLDDTFASRGTKQ